MHKFNRRFKKALFGESILEGIAAFLLVVVIVSVLLGAIFGIAYLLLLVSPWMFWTLPVPVIVACVLIVNREPLDE